MRKINRIIRMFLASVFIVVLAFGCTGCVKEGTSEPIDERNIVRDCYGSMINVQPLNWSEFDESFVYVENENPALSHWIFQIQPRFPDLAANYEWD